jgi:hypothetical protein
VDTRQQVEDSRSLQMVKFHILRRRAMCLAALLTVVRPMSPSLTRSSFDNVFTSPSLFSLFSLEKHYVLAKIKKKKCGHLLILSNIFFILFIMSNLIYLFLNFISWYLIFISSLVLIFLFFFLYFSWFFFIFIHLNLISFSCYKIFNPYSFQFYFFLFLIIFCFFLVLLFINWLIGNLASRFFWVCLLWFNPTSWLVSCV